MKAALAASVNKKSRFLFFTLPGTEKLFPPKRNSHANRNPTTVAEIKRPGKRVSKRGEKKRLGVEECGRNFCPAASWIHALKGALQHLGQRLNQGRKKGAGMKSQRENK